MVNEGIWVLIVGVLGKDKGKLLRFLRPGKKRQDRVSQKNHIIGYRWEADNIQDESGSQRTICWNSVTSLSYVLISYVLNNMVHHVKMLW